MKIRIIHLLAIAVLISGSAVMAEDGPLLGMDRFAKLKQIGKVQPKRSEDIAASPWGLQFNKHDFPMDELELYLERMADTGVKWARVETRDYPIEFSKVKGDGYYRWDEFDQIIDGLNKRKLEIFITINTEPYKGLDSVDKPVSKKNLKKWLTCVASIVERYKGRVRYYEIDNEPKISPNYADLVIAASKVIKGIDPNAKVIAGSIARVNVEGIRMMLEDKGVGPHIDVITFHPYNEFPEGIKHNFLVPIDYGYAPSSPAVAEIFKLLEKEGRDIELWQGECGYPSSEYTTSWKGRGPWGEHVQAKWILRRLLSDFSVGIPVNIYFLLREPPEDDKVNAKGLLVYGTWEPKVGYRALQHLTSVFDQGLMKSIKVEATFEIQDEGSFTGIKGENNRDDEAYEDAKSPMPIQLIGMTGSSGNALIYYAPWRMHEYVKPAKVNIRIKDLSIDDPVLVDLLTGQIYEVKAKRKGKGLEIKGIPLTDYPIAILSRESVK